MGKKACIFTEYIRSMKYLVLLLTIVFFLSCRQAPEKTVETEPQLTILDSIAQVYGHDNWSKVNTIHFTFNVVRPDREYGRSWTWNTRKQEVTSVIEGDTVTYLRSEVDSVLAPVDARFINDKYWLLVPFNLVWDRDSFSYETYAQARAPISGDSLRKLTVVYGDTGGYTPGDAYDFFLDENLNIKEWAFRQGNDSISRLQTRWSETREFNGILLNVSHTGMDGKPRIYFSDIQIN